MLARRGTGSLKAQGSSAATGLGSEGRRIDEVEPGWLIVYEVHNKVMPEVGFRLTIAFNPRFYPSVLISYGEARS